MKQIMYVLQYKTGGFFEKQNLYLGQAMLTDDIDTARQMSLDEAEDKLSCMPKKQDWNIYEVGIGLRLGAKSTRHIKKWRKEELERELAALGEI